MNFKFSPFVVESVIYLGRIGFDTIPIGILNLHIGFKMIIFWIVLSNMGNTLVFFGSTISLSCGRWWEISLHGSILQHVFISTFQLPSRTEYNLRS